MYLTVANESMLHLICMIPLDWSKPEQTFCLMQYLPTLPVAAPQEHSGQGLAEPKTLLPVGPGPES